MLRPSKQQKTPQSSFVWRRRHEKKGFLTVFNLPHFWGLTAQIFDWRGIPTSEVPLC